MKQTYVGPSGNKDRDIILTLKAFMKYKGMIISEQVKREIKEKESK